MYDTNSKQPTITIKPKSNQNYCLHRMVARPKLMTYDPHIPRQNYNPANNKPLPKPKSNQNYTLAAKPINADELGPPQSTSHATASTHSQARIGEPDYHIPRQSYNLSSRNT